MCVPDSSKFLKLRSYLSLAYPTIPTRQYKPVDNSDWSRHLGPTVAAIGASCEATRLQYICGVTPGSFIGPLLLLLYIYNNHDYWSHGCCAKYVYMWMYILRQVHLQYKPRGKIFFTCICCCQYTLYRCCVKYIYIIYIYIYAIVYIYIYICAIVYIYIYIYIYMP